MTLYLFREALGQLFTLIAQTGALAQSFFFEASKFVFDFFRFQAAVFKLFH